MAVTRIALAFVAILVQLCITDVLGQYSDTEQWHFYKRKEYMFSSTTRRLRAPDAERHCRDLGGELASIPSRDVQDWLLGFVTLHGTTCEEYTIGLRLSATATYNSENSFEVTWADGSYYNWNKWAEDQPDVSFSFDGSFVILKVCPDSAEWYNIRDIVQRRFVCSRVATSWHVIDGVSYWLSPPWEKGTREYARQQCHAARAELATVDTSVLLNSLLQHFEGGPGEDCIKIHVGLHSPASRTDWTWLNGAFFRDGNDTLTFTIGDAPSAETDAHLSLLCGSTIWGHTGSNEVMRYACSINSSLTWHNYANDNAYTVSPTSYGTFSYDDAVTRCETLGGFLASLPTQDAYNFMLPHIRSASDDNNCHYFIGLTNPYMNEDMCDNSGGTEVCREGWRWSDGSTYDWRLWLGNEPQSDETKAALKSCRYQPEGWLGYQTGASPHRYICQRGYQPLTLPSLDGIKYYISHPSDTATGENARKACQEMGGDLASLSTPGRLSWLVEQVGRRPSACSQLFIGLLRVQSSWVWTDGSDPAWAETMWAQNEPDAGENFARLKICEDNDVWSGAGANKKFRYICAIEPIDGGHSCWTPWSECNMECGLGTQTRTRDCTNPAPNMAGAPCEEPLVETRECETGRIDVTLHRNNEVKLHDLTAYDGADVELDENGLPVYDDCGEMCQRHEDCKAAVGAAEMSEGHIWYTCKLYREEIDEGPGDPSLPMKQDTVVIMNKVCINDSSVSSEGLLAVPAELTSIDPETIDYRSCGNSYYISKIVETHGQSPKYLVLRFIEFDLSKLPELVGDKIYSKVIIHAVTVHFKETVTLSSELIIHCGHFHMSATASGDLPRFLRPDGNPIVLDHALGCVVSKGNTECLLSVPVYHIKESGYFGITYLTIYTLAVTGLGDHNLCDNRIGWTVSPRHLLLVDQIFVEMSIGCADLLLASGRSESYQLAQYILRYVHVLLSQETGKLTSLDDVTRGILRAKWTPVNSVAAVTESRRYIPLLSAESILGFLQKDTQRIQFTEMQSGLRFIEEAHQELIVKIEENKVALLDIQVGNQKNTVQIEEKRIELLENALKKATDLKNRLNKSFEEAVDIVGEKKDKFLDGLKDQQNRMIYQAAIDSISAMSQFVGGIQTARKQYNDAVAAAAGRKKRSNMKANDGPMAADLEDWQLLSLSDMEDGTMATKSRKKRIIVTGAITGIIAVVGLAVNAAKIGYNIKMMQRQYNRAKDSLERFNEEMENMQLDLVDHDVVFKNIKAHVTSTINADIAQILGANEFKSASVKMCNFAVDYFKQVKEHKRIFGELVVAELKKELADQSIAKYDEWLLEATEEHEQSLAEQQELNEKLAYDYKISMFEVQTSIAHTYVEYCQAFFFHTFLPCGEILTFDHTLTEMFHLLLELQKSHIRDLSHFATPPSHVAASVIIADKKDNCTIADDQDTCPIFNFKIFNSTQLTVTIDDPEFQCFDRVRPAEIRVFLRGISVENSGDLALLIRASDELQDRYKGKEQSFIALPYELWFSYDYELNLVSEVACIDSTMSAYFRDFTPFTTWYIDAPPGTDLSTVTGIEVYFLGSAIKEPGCWKTANAASKREYKAQGMATIHPSCLKEVSQTVTV